MLRWQKNVPGWRLKQRDWAVHVLLRGTARIAIVASCVACSHAFAERATRYAELGGRAARVLKPTVAVVHRTCEQSRRAEFLQQRVLRLKSESLGAALGPEYYADAAHWSEKALSTTAGQTWRDYCQTMDQSAAAFAMGLAALKAHADAVGALAALSQGYHTDFGVLYGGAEALERGIAKQDSPWIKLVPPLTNPIKELSHLWLAERNQGSLKRLITLADPVVHRLVTALDQYLDAIAGQLVTLSARQATLVQSLEQNAGFGARAEATRAMRCPKLAPGAPAADVELAQVCEWSRLQQRQLDELVLLLLHENTEAMTTRAQADAATLVSFHEVLLALDAGSVELARAADNGNEAGLSKAAQNLQLLAEALQNAEELDDERFRSQ